MSDDRHDRDSRPSPDALLQQAARESRGRLKIFLGAAPGVGKTYEMLTTAQAKHREGLDVVVGVIETHGRKPPDQIATAVAARHPLMSPNRQVDTPTRANEFLSDLGTRGSRADD